MLSSAASATSMSVFPAPRDQRPPPTTPCRDGGTPLDKAPGNVAGANGCDTGRVRDAKGRLYDRRRLTDPDAGTTIFVEFRPVDGHGGEVALMVGGASALVSSRAVDIDKAPWDLVGAALGEAAKARGVKSGDDFPVAFRALP